MYRIQHTILNGYCTKEYKLFKVTSGIPTKHHESGVAKIFCGWARNRYKKRVIIVITLISNYEVVKIHGFLLQRHVDNHLILILQTQQQIENQI